MLGDVLARVEILRQQRRRHHQRVPGIREPFACRAIDREHTRRLQRFDSGEVAQRVGVFSVAQPPQHNRSRIAREPFRLFLQVPPHPIAQLRAFGIAELLLRFRRRHLPAVEHLADLLPGANFFAHVTERGE